MPDVGPPSPGAGPSGLPTADDHDDALPVPGVDSGERPAEDAGGDLAGTDPARPRFRLAYVPGATPGKWASVWHERLPDVYLELVQVEAAAVAPALVAGDADAAIGRLPVDKDVFSAIPLYEEASVVCFSRDHLLAALADEETVTSADIAEDPVWVPADDVLFAARPVPGVVPADPDGNVLDPLPTTADVVATVAANAGVAVLPLSLARLHRRKDVTYRLLLDGPTAPVGLVWPVDRTTELVEELIGIVRGRTANSSRGRGGPTRQVSSDAQGSAGAKAGRAGGKGSGKAATGGGSGGSGGGKGRSGAARSGATAAGRGAVQRGVQRGKAARAAVKRKKKGKGK